MAEGLEIPELDLKKLKVHAEEAAMKGAVKTIEEFYNGYDSPFRKSVKEFLEKQEMSWNFNLPEILTVINEKIGKEIDLIANTAVAKSFVPLVARFLTREDKEIKFSDILKEFIEAMKDYSIDTPDMGDFSCSIKKNPSHGWLEIEIGSTYKKEKEYSFTLHTYDREKTSDVQKYQLLSLPYDYSDTTKKTMKLSLDGVTLELPFIKDVLSDKFMSFMARIIIANSHITMDVNDFDEEMFPRDECHC